MPKKIDLTGHRFGRLTVIKDSGKRDKNRHAFWICKCDCGATKTVSTNSLRQGCAKSCGCLRKEIGLQRVKNILETNARKLYNNTSISKIENSHIQKNNTSGVTGVCWDTYWRKWVARITFQNKVIYLGSFKNLEDAAKARKLAEEKYFQPIIDEYYE